ncbi:MAG: 4Fe-4S dicluster domain-containing protein [Coriobacteriaceae bacterium]|nr:4Fe-4S dicluster domain-containing protein [Coriobacteriaceae bacterium]
MRYGMVIDLSRCIGCRTCAVVCKNHHAQPQGIWWNRVITEGADEYGVAVPDGDNFRMRFLPITCQHCIDAPCEQVCPTGATYHDADNGTVLVDYEKCIGCRYCMSACPYGVRQFNWEDPKKIKGVDEGKYQYGYPEDFRKDGHLVYTPNRPAGVVEKCTMCAQYIAQGLNPACVDACPANARIFGDLDDPQSKIVTYMLERDIKVLGEEYNTHPQVYYVSAKILERER